MSSSSMLCLLAFRKQVYESIPHWNVVSLRVYDAKVQCGRFDKSTLQMNQISHKQNADKGQLLQINEKLILFVDSLLYNTVFAIWPWFVSAHCGDEMIRYEP